MCSFIFNFKMLLVSSLELFEVSIVFEDAFKIFLINCLHEVCCHF